jgi:DNA-binding CsgD family transcriptional regulator
MLRTLFVIIFLFIGFNSISQFTFYGEVSDDYKNSKAYLVLVNDYKKNNLLLVENIVSQCHIDSNGTFNFSGDYLKKYNQFFNIYIDNCNNNINDSKHLLNKCDSYISKLFIANNRDTIYFPLNGLNQMLCDIRDVNEGTKNYLYKIDSLQEELLSTHHRTINITQRNIIYKDYFNELKQFSSTLHEPLVELYAYSLYSDKNSFSRNHYLTDIKTSNYYGGLLSKMQQNYPESPYTKQLEESLEQDNYFDKESQTSIYKVLTYLFGLLLISALIFILITLRKEKNREPSIDYKEVLTSQELKVFGLMKQELTNKEIADNLFVSLSTIKSHINNIYTKLSIKSRGEIEKFS